MAGFAVTVGIALIQKPGPLLWGAGLEATAAVVSAAVMTRSPSLISPPVTSVYVPSLWPVATTTRCGLLSASRIHTACSGTVPLTAALAALAGGETWEGGWYRKAEFSTLSTFGRR